MLDLIYIVDESTLPPPTRDNEEYVPNFVMGKQSRAIDIKTETSIDPGIKDGAIATAGVVAGAALNFFPMGLPVSLIASALISAPRLITFLAKNRNENPENPSALAPIDIEEARLLTDFAARHSMTRDQAKTAGYKFQPGHPVIGKDYRRHPLTEGNLYIPNDSYDTILLEERESELIKLLVHLGATKITITKKVADISQKEFKANLTAQATLAGAGMGTTLNSGTENNILDTREFILSGRAWNIDSKVDRDIFFWLPYEPSWKAVVFAREEGGCLTASLEIRENTSLSSNKNLELSVKAKLVEVGAQVGISDLLSEEKTYYVKAEFSCIQKNE